MFQVPSSSGECGRREEGGVKAGLGSSNLTCVEARRDQRTVAPKREGSTQPSPLNTGMSGSGDSQASSSITSDCGRMGDISPSPDDLDDGDSAMGDEGFAAGLLQWLSEGGSDIGHSPDMSWNDDLGDIHPTLPAVNVHVGHMSVFVNNDQLSVQRTSGHLAEAVLRDLY